MRDKSVENGAFFCVVDKSVPSPFVLPPPFPQTNIVFKTLKSFFNHKQH